MPRHTAWSTCLHPFIGAKQSPVTHCVALPLQYCGVTFAAACPAYPQCLWFLWSAADPGHVRLLGVRLLCRQLRGVISVPFLGHWLCDAPSHWEPRIFLFSLSRRSQPHLQLNRPPPATPIRHRIWSSHLAFRRLPSHSVPRVPEDAGERQGKTVSWLPARG